MNEKRLKELLLDVQNNKLDVTDALESLKKLPFEDIEYAKIDNHRELRNGFPEVIYCEGKSIEHVVGIVKTMLTTGNNILATRASKEMFDAVSEITDKAIYYSDSRVILVKVREFNESKSRVLVMTGGTSDIPVAEEAAITARTLGCNVETVYDVGVAGIHRLMSYQDKIFNANVIIVVAGMEGALPSVVGGLADCPVIAVPTSVGYGAHFNGLASLLSMINSCASGIGVVNIDNGFGAGYLASTIVRQIEKVVSKDE